MNSRYVVVLAGGSGARLWPLSRAHRPKQMIPFVEEKSLLELTIERLCSIDSSLRIFIATTAEYEDSIRDAIGSSIEGIIVEPVAKNTAAAFLLSCRTIQALDPEATILFTPADHYVPDHELFAQDILTAYHSAENLRAMVLVGVAQESVNPQFGFIELDAGISGDFASVYKVKKFHEKPSVDVAKEYFTNAALLWNTGIVCAPVDTFMHVFAMHMPTLSGEAAEYHTWPSISFDHGILEHMTLLYVIKGSFRWNDMGSLQAFIPASVAQEKTISLLGAERNIVWSERPVVLAGVSDLCVVVMDDITVVMRRDLAHSADQIAQQAGKQGLKFCR